MPNGGRLPAVQVIDETIQLKVIDSLSLSKINKV